MSNNAFVLKVCVLVIIDPNTFHSHWLSLRVARCVALAHVEEAQPRWGTFTVIEPTKKMIYTFRYRIL